MDYLRVAADRGVEVPAVLPAAAEMWGAFLRVRACRHLSFGGAAGPDWVEIAVLLKLTHQWREDIYEGLETCFGELLTMEAEERAVMRAAAEEAKRG